jgi:hypothetical protein
MALSTGGRPDWTARLDAAGAPDTAAAGTDAQVWGLCGGHGRHIQDNNVGHTHVRLECGDQSRYYTNVACKQHGTLPARIFAQCQFQMLVTGTPACVLVEWHVTAARALVIALDPAWCGAALRALSACWKYVRANDALPPFDARAGDGSKELGQLLKLTKASCARYTTLLKGKGTIALRLGESLGSDKGKPFNK